MYENVYVHVPFCRDKCGYCAFYSVPDADESLQSLYVGRIEQQMQESLVSGTIRSVYFGGGTPTVLPRQLFERMLLSVNASFKLAHGAEISVECNPESVDESKVALLASFANRVSLGVQSFSAHNRHILGRHADLTHINRAVELFRQYGITNLGMDLIYAVPGQSLEDWLGELETAVSYGIGHLSCYSLTVEEGTPIAEQHGLDVVDEEMSADMWHATEELLRKYGLRRYEISNYALPGMECRHNMSVWHGGSYLGFGPAACSFDGKRRWAQCGDVRNWLAGAEPEFDEIPVDARAREIFAFGLRTAAGWTASDWELLLPEIRDSMSWNDCLAHPELRSLVEQGLLDVSPEAVVPTSRGLAFWDNIAASLL